MLDPDVKVVRTTEESLYDQALKKTTYIRVEFLVGDHGPFTEKFGKDGYSALVRDQKLNDFAREVR
jgi:hypothetical protein